MTPTRGEVWWAEVEGQAGRRPMLVLTRSEAIQVLGKVVVAPITRTVRGLRSEVRLEPEDGMPTSCAASFDNLATIPKANLTELVTVIGPHRLLELCDALRFALDC